MPTRLVAAAVCILSLAACPSGGGALIVSTDGTSIARFVVGERRASASIAGDPVRPQSPAVTDALIAGKVAVVNFWGSWCGPCRLEEPILETVWNERKSGGVVFIGVNTRRDQRAAATAFLDEFRVTYPSVYDPSSEIAYAFGVRAMPATFILDTQGRVAAQIIGAIASADDLRALLDEVAAS